METNTPQDSWDIPNRTPEQILEYQLELTVAVQWAYQHYADTNDYTNKLAGDIIIISYLLSDHRRWIQDFRPIRDLAERKSTDRGNFWKAIIDPLKTDKVQRAWIQLHPKTDPRTVFENYRKAYTQTNTAPSIDTKTNKTRAPDRGETLITFVTNHAPSENYIRVFISISRHTKNALSKRGQQVYPYGENHIARERNVSLRTVRRIFSWLKRQHIIFPRTPHRYFKPGTSTLKNKCATWYVCTSLKQSAYFLDPQQRRHKKTPRRSPRKRHLHAVNT